MARNHFYFAVEKAAVMTQPNWVKLIQLIEGTPYVPAVIDPDTGKEITPAIEGTPSAIPGTNDLRQNTLQIRHNNTDPLDPYNFDAAIYEGNFDDADVSLEKIRRALVTAAGVQDSRITTTVATTKVKTLDSAVAQFKFNGTTQFGTSLFGRDTDTKIVTWGDSLSECLEYLRISPKWQSVGIISGK